MSDKYIFTVDLGTSGPKIVLFDVKGKVIDHDFVATSYQLISGGGAEQNPADWWNAIKTGIQRIVKRYPDCKNTVEAISVTTQWSGTVAVDKNAKPLMNALIWMDSRGAGQIKKATGGFIEMEGYGISKLLHWLRITGGIPTAAGKDPIAHILYIKETFPEIYNKTYKFLEPKDYINLILTGEYISSYDTMVLHWVTDNRDINNIKYSKKLLHLAGIEREKLPEMVYADEVIGTLRKEIALELGLSEGIKIIAGTPDVNSAAIGSGAIHQDEAHIYIGTSSWLASYVPYKKTDIFHNIASLPSALRNKYLITNEQETAGECINFMRDNILFHKDVLNTRTPENYYELINELAADSPRGSKQLIFTPWLYGERSPIEDNTVRGGFHNLSLQHTRKDMIRAVFEGVAFNNRWLLKYVEKLAGTQFKHINFIGGGALSDLWSQILADVLQREIHQMEYPVLVNARGAFILAAIGLDYISSNDIPNLAKVKAVYQPKTENTEIYNQLFKEYLNIYNKNKGIYKRLNG